MDFFTLQQQGVASGNRRQLFVCNSQKVTKRRTPQRAGRKSADLMRKSHLTNRRWGSELFSSDKESWDYQGFKTRAFPFWERGGLTPLFLLARLPHGLFSPEELFCPRQNHLRNRFQPQMLLYLSARRIARARPPARQRRIARLASHASSKPAPPSGPALPASPLPQYSLQ